MSILWCLFHFIIVYEFFYSLIVGKPPNPLYIGCNPTLCKLLKVPNHICCLELNRECEHKTNAQASDYKWRNKCILVVAECATNGLFNFILPLRAQVRSVMFLRPIVLLLENTYTINKITLNKVVFKPKIKK